MAREQASNSVHGTRAGVQRSSRSQSALRFHPSSSPAAGGQVPHPSPRCAAPVRRSPGRPWPPPAPPKAGKLWRRRRRVNFSEGGFTLIEMMVVIVIIMILVGIVVGAAKYAQTKGARSRAEAEIAAMETALESYKNDNGAYPLSTATRDSGSGNAPGPIAINNCVLLYSALAGGSKVYMTFKPGQLGKDPITTKPYIIDPFGRPYNYYYQVPPNPLPANQATFDLWSCGPAGTNEPPNNIINNITNWKQ